jgi:hypothetical protein
MVLIVVVATMMMMMMNLPVVTADFHIMCVPGDAFTTLGLPLGLLLQTSTCTNVRSELNALLGACAAKAKGPDPDLADGSPLMEYTEGQELLQAVVEAALVNSTTTSTTTTSTVSDGPVRHLLRNMEKENLTHHPNRELGTQEVCRELCTPQCSSGSCPSACCSLCYSHGIRCAYGGRRRRLTRELQAATTTTGVDGAVEPWGGSMLGLVDPPVLDDSTPTTVVGTKVSVEDAQALFASTVQVISDICTKDYQAYVAMLLASTTRTAADQHCLGDDPSNGYCRAFYQFQ